jgi:alkyl hydroperoxide reductase subunit D
MKHVDALAQALPDPFKDLRLNLTSMLQNQNVSLPPSATWAVALASAAFLGRPAELLSALLADAAEALSPAEIADAKAAAAIMGMNTVYYRSKHLLDKPAYHERKAGLRMTYMGKPQAGKVLFEQCSMACAALAGCAICLQSHEATLRQHEVSEDQIHDILRIAAVVNGFAVAVSLTHTPAP